VRVFDERDGGGFDCIPKGMVLALAGTDATNEAVSLAGPWKYSLERPLDPESLSPFPAGMPYPPFMRRDQPNQLPGSLYNGMIHPLLGYGFAGAAWYQGESNTDRGEQYRALLPAMIGDWRRGAGRDFPFLIVQLPTYGGGTSWAEVREAQAMTARHVPKTGLAVIMDINDGSLHPVIKLPVGQRLALTALSVAYGKTNISSGPVYRSMTIEGKTIRLRFDSIGGGLTINSPAPGVPRPSAPPELKGFALAGADMKFYPAKARIEADSVVLWTDYVPAPVAARYGFSNYTADANLGNIEGLPCGGFRTDDWPVDTTGRR
jgi:sialate O-acetylesterase